MVIFHRTWNLAEAKTEPLWGNVSITQARNPLSYSSLACLGFSPFGDLLSRSSHPHGSRASTLIPDLFEAIPQDWCRLPPSTVCVTSPPRCRQLFLFGNTSTPMQLLEVTSRMVYRKLLKPCLKGNSLYRQMERVWTLSESRQFTEPMECSCKVSTSIECDVFWKRLRSILPT